MRFTILLCLHFLLLLKVLNAQSLSVPLDAPQISAHMNHDGALFFNNYEEGGLSVTEINGEATNIKVAYAGGLWIAAKKADEEFSRVCRSMYLQEDFLSGPTDYDGDINLNKVWKVSGQEIQNHIQDFSDGTIDQTPPINILEWPGYANQELGPDFPEREFAPFFDQNNDGIYDALAGDYPIINQDMAHVLPYELAYTVFHEDPQSDNPIGLEVHATMYSLQCDDLPALDRSIFTSHRIVNHSQDYDEFYLGYWQDADLGCIVDDYVGCDSERNTFYTYNENPVDGGQNSFCEGYASFGENVPVHSTRFLNQPLYSFGMLFKNLFDDFPIATHNPVNDEEIKTRLQGKWIDGSSFSVGDIGYDPTSTEQTMHQYSSDPTDMEGWSMNSFDFPLSDRTSLATIPSQSLAQGESLTFDMIQLVTLDENYNHIQKVALSLEEADQIQEAYNSNFANSCSSITAIEYQKTIEIFNIHPNPTQNTLHVVHEGEVSSYEIFDVMGRKVQNGNLAKSDNINLELKEGIYWIRLNSSDFEYAPRKFVVVNN